MIPGMRTAVRRISRRAAIVFALLLLAAALRPPGDGRAETTQRTPGPESTAPQNNAPQYNAPARENVMGVEQPGFRTPASFPPAAPAERRARERAARDASRDAARRFNWGLFAVHAEPDWEGLLLRGIVLALTIPVTVFLYRRTRGASALRAPGFEVISPSETRQWVPLEEKYTQLDFVSKIKTRGALRLSANLNKVGLSNRKFGYLMEDKNFRNALLVNRRRVRRTLLKDGDVLDLGDLTLLYRDHRGGPGTRYAPATAPEGKAQIKFDRPRGPLRRGVPILYSDSQPARSFAISKNLVFVGRSEDNDLIIKSPDVHSRHAKIERVGGRYKLQDLSMAGSTYVNGRRVEQRFLREGDEISIDAHRFKFSFVARPVRERPQSLEPVPDEMTADTEELAAPEEVAAFAPDPEGERVDAPPRV